MNIGTKTNHLTLLRISGKTKAYHQIGLFQCSCGTKKHIQIRSVACNDTLSCGCIKKLLVKNLHRINTGKYRESSVPHTYTPMTGLVHLRKLNTLTQKQLADILNVHPQSISRWEQGDRFPIQETINKLCHFFQCNKYHLYLNSLSEAFIF